MQYRKLGHSGLQVSLLSFGSWVSFHNQVDQQLAAKLMAYAYDKGINFFDNAEVYAHGKAEIIMGQVLKSMQWDRSSYLVSSKVFFGRGDKRPNMTGLSRKHIREACDEALIRMQLNYLDLFFAHRPDKNTPIEETVWAMNQLIHAGKILYWGTSEWSAQEIMEAHLWARQYHLIGPTMEQPQYNMLTRNKIEVEYSQIFKTVGLGTTIWSPLASGILTTKYLNNQIPEGSRMALPEYQWLKEKNLLPENLKIASQLNLLAQQLNTTLPKLAIAWCAQNPNVSTVILGATRLEQLEETIESLDALPLLTKEVNEQIENILNNKPATTPY
ncbi:MAG: aldo/keto reductase [Saprospiraceae bacterium]|nr:aldo/keto reductase [Saprospiraceae bacterium]MBK7736533.1 aldo/keto reductase [Saprospiraceae bacterium]MBK7912103.1 aldo/keto reductase [Saprospiraceae bacterium]